MSETKTDKISITRTFSLALASIAIASATIFGVYTTHNANCLWALIFIPVLFGKEIF